MTTLRAAAREVTAHSQFIGSQLDVLALELTQMGLFGSLVAAAVFMRDRRDWHKRLMMCVVAVRRDAAPHESPPAPGATFEPTAQPSLPAVTYDQAPMETLMKRTPIIAALVLSTVSTTIAQQESGRTRAAASTEQAVQQQDQERIRAQIAADTVVLRRIYADDFFGIGPTGVVRSKAEVIADFASHTLRYQSITTAEVRVRVYGNTAVETGRSTMVGQDRGKAVPRENRFTRVWVMTGGRWQLVANHYSLMTTQSE